MNRAPIMRSLALAVLVLLGGCAQTEVRVGSKDFSENRIVAEMLIALIEDQGIRTVRVPAFSESGAAFASLRAGTLDVYPDYVATLLARLGEPSDLGRDEGRAIVESALSEVGLSAFAPIGFDDGYVAVTTRDVARIEGLSRIEDLGDTSKPLRIGVSQGFARRPDNGLDEAIDRLGLQDATIVVAEAQGRAGLYDDLVDGSLDLVVGFRTDPQIRDYKLTLLGPSEVEAPNYDAIPLVRSALLEVQPEIGDALSALAGQIDTAAMRQLVARVDLDGAPPRTVARDALSELGLIAAAPRPTAPPLRIAMDPSEIGEIPAIRTVRAARMALPGRDIDPVAAEDPLAAMLSAEARVALVPASALFDPDTSPPKIHSGLVSLAAPGRSFVHVLAPAGPAAPNDGHRIATGPVGSPSHRLARMAAPWLPPETELIPLPQSDAASAAEAILTGEADRALVLSSLGRSDLETVLSQGQVRLVSWSAWLTGPARIALSFLREATIADGYYGPAQVQTPTVSMQTVVVGPAAPDRHLGRGGPSTYSEDLFPVPDRVVLDFNENLGATVDIAPQLSPAKILSPRPLAESAPLNPNPASTFLSILILAFLLLAAWLLVRPASERDRG